MSHHESEGDDDSREKHKPKKAGKASCRVLNGETSLVLLPNLYWGANAEGKKNKPFLPSIEGPCRPYEQRCDWGGGGREGVKR